MNDEDKIKWILENWGKAKARAKNLEVKAKNLQYSLAAKTSVGGRGSGDGPSEQERHVVNKDEIEFDARALMWNIEAIEESVNSLKEEQRKVVQYFYFDDLTIKQILNRMMPEHEIDSKRTIRRRKQNAIKNLVDRRLTTIYHPLNNILETDNN